MKTFFNMDYNASQFSFETTRKSKFVADKAQNTPGVEVVDPANFYAETEQLLTTRHKTRYVLAVKNGEPTWLAESQGFMWDEGIYKMALAHNAGIVAAVDTVMNDKSEVVSGSFSSGLHHAKADSGSGYCTFNGLAVGALAARKRGAERILCLDFDAHCGGGTYEMTRDIGLTQVDVSTSMFDSYNIVDNSKLFYVKNTDQYLDAIQNALNYADSIGGWDFVFYNAGMDPINMSVTAEQLAEREKMVAKWATDNGYPTVFTLAGGYLDGRDCPNMDVLSDLHMLTVNSFAQCLTPTS